MQEAKTPGEDGGIHVDGIEVTESGKFAEETATQPAEAGEAGKVDGERGFGSEGFLDLKEVKIEDGGLAEALETAAYGGPVYCGVKAAAKENEVIHGAEGRPDALIVGMLDLRVNDEVSHQVSGGWNSDASASEIEGARFRDNLGGGKERRADAHADAVVQLEMDGAGALQRRVMVAEMAELVILLRFEAVLHEDSGSG
jgi:hypothetical protein